MGRMETVAEDRARALIDRDGQMSADAPAAHRARPVWRRSTGWARSTTARLRGVDLSIGTGEMVAVVGPSGSGKTTILNLITGIDRPTAGSVTVDGQRLDEMSEEQLAVWRGAQRRSSSSSSSSCCRRCRRSRTPCCRLPTSHGTARSASASSGRATTSSSVGLGDKLDHLPAELSGGEQQRVAIARSLAADPKLIVGDEPTGKYSTGVTAEEMFDLLARLNGEGRPFST